MSKELLAKKIAEIVENNQCIGVGTGKTVEAAIKAIAGRVSKDKLACTFATTSAESTELCQQLGLVVIPLEGKLQLSWGFDGLDAIDTEGRAIKGKGAALLKEKILAVQCPKYYLVFESSKKVASLDNFPIPIEILPEARYYVEQQLATLGATSSILRSGTGKHGAVITEHGNVILDTSFPKVDNSLQQKLRGIVGVVETGLFCNFATHLVSSDGKTVELSSCPSYTSRQ